MKKELPGIAKLVEYLCCGDKDLSAKVLNKMAKNREDFMITLLPVMNRVGYSKFILYLFDFINILMLDFIDKGVQDNDDIDAVDVDIDDLFAMHLPLYTSLLMSEISRLRREV